VCWAFRSSSLPGEIHTSLRAAVLPFGYKAEWMEKFSIVLLILAELWKQPNKFI
jgi:hypothetical protein